MADNKRKDASELAKKHRDISIAEFFEKNRHLLGFDNPRKALLTVVKEAVDNSLDACEEAGILPEISVEIIDMMNNKFKIMIEDNGPGIIRKHIPKIFGKLLYGSKFHSLKMSRGQQGIGISAAALYSQITTGKPIEIKSKIGKDKKGRHFLIRLDTKKNEPIISKDEEFEWEGKETGTWISLEIEGSYSKGRQSVDEYLKETAVVNPHAMIIYTNPHAEQILFPRVSEELPKEAKEIKPHPYGVELGMLIKMLESTSCRTLHSFLMEEFTRVGSRTAKEICQNASLLPNMKPKRLTRDLVEKLKEGINKTKIIAPPANCISPIGEELLEKGLRKEINAEFYCAISRSPAVYRGNPFIIECSLAYGGEQDSEGSIRLMRFANRVPLLYQQGACGITNAVSSIAWRLYGLKQSRNSLPQGPLTLVVHMASVWVPFTSESKEALAHYPELIKEIRLAVQECGRKLASYVRKRRRIKEESKKRDYIEKCIPHIADAIKDIMGLGEVEKKKIEDNLFDILEHTRGELEELGIDNPDYDPELAKIGREESPHSTDKDTEKSDKKESDAEEDTQKEKKKGDRQEKLV